MSSRRSAAVLTSLLRFLQALALGSVLALALGSRAEAQDGAPLGAYALDRPCDCTDQCSSQRKRREPMAAYAVGVKLGYAKVGTGKVRNPAYSAALADIARMFPEETLIAAGLRGGGCTPLDQYCRTEARAGFHLAIPVQVGGSGVGFRLEPYLTAAEGAMTFGAYAGPTFEFRVANPLYLGIGFGMNVARVSPDGWKYAIDVYGRIPAHLTYYFINDLALVVEFAFGAGASAFVNKPRRILNPQTGRPLANAADLTFGVGRTWDMSIGLRFP